ncbi:MAG: hypothetical protein E4H14_05990, partial [Candidatus Thorarchaeota archaeon]
MNKLIEQRNTYEPIDAFIFNSLMVGGNLEIGKVGLVCLVTVALTVSLWIPSTNHMVDTSVRDQPKLDTTVAYEFHYQISILGDEAFETLADVEGWDGDGSSETPYLIQDYLIAENIGNIWIEDTTVHFKIINCYLHTALTDLTLWNVTNAVIENCMFKYSTTAVHLFNCTSVNVVNCTIEAVQDGIFIEDCINCYIGGSTIVGIASSESGIDGLTNTGLEICNNTISDWDDHGIQLYQCTGTEINNNTMYWNEGYGSGACGINVDECDTLSILGNNITKNADNGITIDDSPSVSIIQNQITDNDEHGVYVSWSDFCTIIGNTIGRNGDGLISGGPSCGIVINHCQYPQILNNTLDSNIYNGISSWNVDHLLISDNLITNSYM